MTQAVLQPDVETVDDDALLRRYRSDNDGAALEQLVRRYAPMVYAAARRMVRDPATADDVAQTAFITLARRAGSIRSGAVLGAWLLQTTRYAAANAIKAEATRRHYEQEARMQLPHPQADPADLAADAEERSRWQAMRPVLDRAIACLPRRDQSAVILRFFRGLSHSEIARSMGTNEEAARKRVSRALARLRGSLVAMGAWPMTKPATGDSGDLALGVMLSSHAVEAAAAKSITQVLIVAKAAGDAARASIFHGVLTMSAGTKAAVAGIVTASVLGAGYFAVKHALADQVAQQPATKPVALTPTEFLIASQDYFEKWTADDALAAYWAQNDAQRTIAHALAAQSVAGARLVKLASQRWGSAAETAVAHAYNDDTRGDDATAQVTIDGDHATVKFKSDSVEDYLLVRVNGNWKFDMAAYEKLFGPRAAEIVRTTLKTVPNIEKEIADVKAGKYMSADALVAEINRQNSAIAPGQ